MAAAALLVPSILAGLGSFLQGKADKTQKQTQEQSGTSTTNYNSQTAPYYDPLQLSARDFALQAYMKRLNTDPDLSGYGMSGIRGINQNANLQQKTLANLMASRGMAYSPAGFNPIAGVESNRINQITEFENSLPLLIRKLQGEDLGAFGQFLASLPTGQTKTGSDTTNSSQKMSGTTTQPGSWMSAIGSGINSGASAYLGAKEASNSNDILKKIYGID